MNTYVVISDATLDLPQNVIEDLNIQVMPMHFTVGEQEYTHYPDERELSLTKFYSYLKEGQTASTSQITPVMYQEFFEPYLKEGKDIIYISLSSGLSGTYQSSVLGATMVLEDYEDRKVTSIDSISASIGEGLLVYYAAQNLRNGMSYEDNVAWIEANKGFVEHWFTVEDLFHLTKGGRLSMTSAVVGTALKIKPALSIDAKGGLYVAAKIRGAKKSLEYMITQLKERGADTQSQTVIVGHADNPEVAEKLRDVFLEQELVKDVIISGIGPVIGGHVGPGMIAVTFMGSAREKEA